MEEKTAALVLSLMCTRRLSLNDAITLYEAAGSAKAVLENRHDIRTISPDATPRLEEIMKGDISSLQKRAEEEQQWCESKGIKVVSIADMDYPQRLRQCPDAPMVLFTRGKADLNREYIINMVGTRECTTYGRDVVSTLIKDLSRLCPEIMVVSGLAYGIDIAAHRAAIENNLCTVGVVAHGQDTLYPTLHRREANQMVSGNGAVVTEYFRGTQPVRQNFLQRNRIIAGMADATIVVESASHGGGLVTARLAQDYNREVFAVPGPVNAEHSKGCNNLIRDNKAALISSAEDIISLMQWERAIETKGKSGKCIEREIFVELSPIEQQIVEALRKHGDSQANTIAVHTSLPINIVFSTLFSLEMKGVAKPLAGNIYHLIS